MMRKCENLKKLDAKTRKHVNEPRPVTHYVFFGMGFRVFRFWGHFFIAYLGYEKISSTKVSK